MNTDHPIDTPDAPPRAGTRLGPWQLRELIGSGGMGDVWAAVRSDGLHAGRAAVKVLRAAVHEPGVSAVIDARFAREGELLGRLTHPHIAQLLDAGIATDGSRYLVLEYVAGQRIDHWCDARQLDIAARLALLQQVCEAVAFAHAHLVVHRDLKPANILVTENGHVKLLDFGVAKLLEDTPGGQDLTQLGAAGLTPEYAAPEQISGAPVTVATDVYALGVLMFVLLSGQRPYGRPGSSPVQLARAIIESEPRRLSAATTLASPGDGHTDPDAAAAARSTSPQRLRQQLRGDLDHIVAKALCKRPADRYASVQALADDIARFLRHESVSAQAPTWAYLSRKFVQRHKVGVAAAGVVAIAVAGGVAATLWQARVAREQAALARTEAANATAIKDFLLGVFDTSSVGDGKTTQNTTARDLLQSSGQRLLADHALAPAARLELLTAVGSLENNLGLFDAADPLQREALNLARDVYGAQSEKYVYALVERGLSLNQLGRPGESDQLTREAVAIIESTGRQAGESYAVALYQLGYNAMLQGELPTALGYLQRSTAAFAAHQPQHPMRAIAHRWLGNVYARSDDFIAAERELRQSTLLSAGQAKLRDYGVALGHYSLGQLMNREGRFKDAAAELTQALAPMEATMGPRHRAVALVRNQLARAQHGLGDTAAANENFALAQDIARDDSSRAPGNAMDQVNLSLGLAALDDGRFDEAQARLHAAADRWSQPGGTAWAEIMVSLADAETMRGDLDGALRDLQQAQPLLDAKLGAGALETRHAQVVRGEALERRGGAVDEARLAYATALNPSAQDAAAASPTQAWLRARATLGLARLALPGDPARALKSAREAIALISAPGEALRAQRLRQQALEVEARAKAARG